MRYPKIDDVQMQEICNVLAAKFFKLDINDFLFVVDSYGIVEDSLPTKTLKFRIFNLLWGAYCADHSSIRIVSIIEEIMRPEKYQDSLELYQIRKEKLNNILSFIGLEISEEGQIIKYVPLEINDVIIELKARNIHLDILKNCEPYIRKKDYFDALMETVKFLFEKIQEKSKLNFDGKDLVERAFNIKNPVLRINRLVTKSERMEQQGFIYLLVGIYMMFRDPMAHERKTKIRISKKDFLDIITFISFILRKIDITVYS